MFNDANIGQRPVAYPGLSHNQTSRNGAKAVTVKTVTVVVTQHEIFIVFQIPGAITARIAEILNVRLVQQFSIDVHTAFFDPDCLTRQAHNALDKILANVFGIVQHNNIATLRCGKEIGESVDDNQLARIEVRLHALPFDHSAGCGEIDQRIDGYNQEQDFENIAQQ